MFLLDSLGAGGAERSTAVLLPHLAARGIEVSVVTLYTAIEGSETEVRDAGITVRVLGPGSYWRSIKALRAILRTERPDVLHTALYAADQIGRLAAAGLSTKVISSFVSVPRTKGQVPPGSSAWKIAIVNVIDAITGHLFVDQFHAVTAGVARSYACAYRIKPAKVTVVERGRDHGAFGERSAERRERVLGTLGLGVDTPVIVAAGRQEHLKAHDDLVRAMELLLKRHPDAVLLIAGREGNASQALQNQIAATPSVAGNVRVLGYRTDVLDLLAAADVMALASRYEGTAGIALEAMALGTPIVSTRLDGMEGILVDEVNSLLVDIGDVAAMAAAIDRLIADSELGAQLAQASRQVFLERFTLDRSADLSVALYTDVISRRGGR
jgi:glycosyltransferase involved in cell wall biosynthesis